MSKKIYAFTDIHGCYDEFRDLIDDKINPDKDDLIVLLGDYIDRGPDSKKVIDKIIYMMRSGYNIIPLSGNHENLMLNTLSGNFDDYILWMQNGGDMTLKSFEKKSTEELESKYLDFFRNLKYYHAHENYLFVHGGFKDEAKNPFEDYFYMIWNCKEEYENPLLKDKIIIHGHCPHNINNLKKQISENKNVIDIDTGCIYGKLPGLGNLSAIELPSKKLYHT